MSEDWGWVNEMDGDDFRAGWLAGGFVDGGFGEDLRI